MEPSACMFSCNEPAFFSASQEETIKALSQEPLGRSASSCSSQTMLEACTSLQSQRSTQHYKRSSGAALSTANTEDSSSEAFDASSLDPQGISAPQHSGRLSLEGTHDRDDGFPSRYQACVSMIRHHQLAEQSVTQQTAALAEGNVLDDGSRMIVVSWMVEVAEEFGLQQETLHAAVSLLDRFLSTSNGVPRCVLQLVAVGCIFLSSKQLEVHHPSVEQMVQVAAHSFTQGDLLRVERILLDALEFNVTGPTAYAFLHLLTQATISLTTSDVSSRSNSPLAAAAAAAAAASSPPMEVVVSLAMYLTELALLDQTCLIYPGSLLATAALLLAHTTLSGHYCAWPMVLAAAGISEAEVAPALSALSRLHVAALLPPSAQVSELLMPLKLKFGQECWCKVSLEVTPLALQQPQQQQQQQQQVAAAATAAAASADINMAVAAAAVATAAAAGMNIGGSDGSSSGTCA